MCGISAIVVLPHDQLDSSHGNDNSEQASSEVKARRAQLTEEMEASLKNIQHRGPDYSGIWISPDEKIVLGHARLAIRDLTPSGNQPLHNPDNTIHAVVNGEIYDYEEIKSHLIQETDYQFSSHTDSELVLALYQAYGLDFVQHLRGEFAICIYDEPNRLFIAVRDRYGIKPLFWTIQNGRLLVGAEIKAFLPLGWEPEWDVKSIVEAGWNFDERTLFRGVKKVRPGTMMLYDIGGEGRVEERKWWDIEYPDKTVLDTRTEAEIVQGVRERLEEAVRIRLRADVPIGVYLSGGIDSSVIAGLVTDMVKKEGRAMGNLPSTDRVSCFSVAFEKTSGFDESDVAERTAEWLGVKFHKQIMDEEAFASRFELATWHCEHHNPDLNYIGKFALSEIPQNLGFKVVLTGEGSDEIFTGYHIYLPDVLREPDLTWQDTLPEDERVRLFNNAEAENARYYNSIGADGKEKPPSSGRKKLNNITTLSSMAAFIPQVFDAKITSALNALNPEDVIANDVDAAVLEKMQKKWHPINTAQYVWTKNHLPNQFMSCLGDRTEMAHSIEGRTPFLDHRLTEYVNGIPPSLKMRWNGKGGGAGAGGAGEGEGEGRDKDGFTAKWVLREAMRPYVTEELYRRAKHPYSAPTRYAKDGPLGRLLRGLVTEENVRELGFVDWEKARGALERAFGSGKGEDRNTGEGEDREEDKEGNAAAARLVFVVAQWVVLGKRFGVKTAGGVK